MWPNPQFAVGFITITEEFLKENFIFLHWLGLKNIGIAVLSRLKVLIFGALMKKNLFITKQIVSEAATGCDL